MINYFHYTTINNKLTIKRIISIKTNKSLKFECNLTFNPGLNNIGIFKTNLQV